MAKKKLADGITLDFETRAPIVRPVLKPRFKYDFDMRRKADPKGRWLYVNSVDDLKNKMLIKQMKVTRDNDGEWRIVDVTTNQVVKASRQVRQNTRKKARKR